MTLKELIIRHEGFRLYPYKDSMGLKTIGVGHCIDRKPLPLKMAQYLQQNGFLTTALVHELADLDIAEATVQASRISWFKGLDDARQKAIISLVFNLGLNGFLNFKKMVAAMGRGDFSEAAKELLDSRWARQVGRRAPETAKIILTGKIEF